MPVSHFGTVGPAVKRLWEELRVWFLLGSAKGFLAGSLIVVLALAAAYLGSHSPFDRAVMDPELDAAFDRGTADADAWIDLMPNLPDWISRDMRAEDVNSALFDRAHVVCGAQTGIVGFKTFLCNRNIPAAGAEHCQTTYSVEASFESGRLSTLKGQRARYCG
jgi:hypothetical protein